MDDLQTTFLLQQIKHSALREMEQRIEKHLKAEFYNKWLPKTIEDIRRQLIIEIVEDHDCFDLKIYLKGESDEQSK